METKYYHIIEMLSGLDELHTRHINSFNDVSNPDIEQQTWEREDAFGQFKNEMTSFIQTCNEMADQEKAELMLDDLKNRIHILLEQNKILATKIEKKKGTDPGQHE